jgi:hypothetical protein
MDDRPERAVDTSAWAAESLLAAPRASPESTFDGRRRPAAASARARDTVRPAWRQ